MGERLLRGAVIGAILGASVAGVAGISWAQPSAHAKTPLQQGLEFYAGKTITLICPVGVGDVYDLLDRAAAPTLSAYLHATVNVEDISIGGTVGGSNRMTAAPPDGLTFGNIVTQSYMQDIVTGIMPFTFNIRKLVDLGTTPTGAYLIASNPTSPYTTYAKVRTAAAPVKIITTTGPLEDNLINGAFGARVTDLPEGSVGPDVQGFLRGDAPLIGVSLGGLEPLVEQGKARPLMLWGSTSYPPGLRPYLKNVPTATQYLKKHAIGRQAAAAVSAANTIQAYQMFFMAPAGTPTPQVTALRAALRLAMNSPQVKASDIITGLGPGYVQAPTANAELAQLLSAVAAIRKFANG